MFSKIFNQVKDIKGWMSETDCKVLYNHASKVEGTIVEIGAFMGRSGKVLALSSPKSQVYSVDSFPCVYDYYEQKFAPVQVRDACLNNVSKLDNWHLIQKRSVDVAKEWNKKIDFLTVDGEHCKRAVLEDIDSWYPFVKKGSYIIFHDYCDRPHEWEIQFAVNERKHLFTNIKQEGGFGVCQKK